MHAFSKLYHADIVCPSKGQTSVVLSSIFCLNPVPNVYSTTPVEVLLELLFAYLESIIASFEDIWQRKLSQNVGRR